ncbi:ImmA/IrrE family metallo-endopeptidase [Lederbergia lenta]|uniref:ImmA/IrrE family metallo-endopeptidase n=1 Tax=Lederbergia lenta TaxID=1467 RepID=UPI0020421F19|nr:ImmA/IrrE family metallo-endopeptidase [Lederbergia lenta]MCM3110638.1 ImmA/IrrE family metallo-endopeptidase [Lederbergia lenta]
MYSYLEDYIYELYSSIGVKDPIDLQLYSIARRIGVKILYKEKPFRFNNEVILREGSISEEWMEFGHEICHYLRHCGNQLIMHPLFRELQEWQADYFAYHFCVPTFMLSKITMPNHRNEAIWLIAETFNVEVEFAERRLDMWINKRQSFIYFNQVATPVYKGGILS